jgi:hypothetical protein
MRFIRRFTMLFRLLFLVSTLASVSSFTPATSSSSYSKLMATPAHLVEPKERNAHYSENVAQYLVDLHDNQATFNFCGGMMFQLVLSEKLREHLLETKNQPVIADASKRRMHNLPDYQQTADADNVHVFHGREIRKVPTAAGGMGFVLQLSLADGDDPEGWTAAEIEGYDGWAHDVGRTWRRGDILEKEGFKDFRKKFGPDSFALHHRFYLHKDGNDRMWLSAEDGCEGTPSTGASNPLSNLFGLLG